MNHLHVTGITKKYRGGKVAVSDLSLSLEPGVFGLVGKNGAGKSTLIAMLATALRPDSGAITWNGVDVLARPRALRSVLGYLPQDFGVYPNLSATEFLMYTAALKGLPSRQARKQIASLLEQLNLGPVAGNIALAGFSGGMRQRVGIAQTLLGDPQLLIFDEPTVGLDPVERESFLALLKEMAGTRIVILSTHIVGDVASIADSIAVMNEGRLGAPTARSEFLGSEDDRNTGIARIYTMLSEMGAR